MNSELKKIKKKYGEKFAYMCRTHFSTILEHEGKLFEILENHFAESRNIYEDIIKNELEIQFKNYIYSKYDTEKENGEKEENRTPYEILDEAGYELIECHTEEEIQSFRKWYAPSELICTIYNGGRLESSVCFFAVKKNAEEIKRKDFWQPRREDEYGTSVLGIQFDKYGTCTPHIINRYNHTVANPNGTYGNSLDKIAVGLEESFKTLLLQRGLQLNTLNVEEFEIPGYTVASDGKYYKYNMEINGIYYCENNVIINHGEIKKFDKEKYLVLDYFVLDLENKSMKLYDEGLRDSFVNGFKDFDKIEIKKNKEEKGKKTIIISSKGQKDVKLEIDKSNNVIGYENENITDIEDAFMFYNKSLFKLSLPQVQNVGDAFLYRNTSLTDLEIPYLQSVGDDFLCRNLSLTELELPQLQYAGNQFLIRNKILSKIELPQLQSAGDDFLNANRGLSELSLPQLKKVGYSFLRGNRILNKLLLPQVQCIGEGFLYWNEALTRITLPEIQKIGRGFLRQNKSLIELNLPKEFKGKEYLSEEKLELLDKKKVSKADIAQADKRFNITTSEIENVENLLDEKPNIKTNDYIEGV